MRSFTPPPLGPIQDFAPYAGPELTSEEDLSPADGPGGSLEVAGAAPPRACCPAPARRSHLTRLIFFSGGLPRFARCSSPLTGSGTHAGRRLNHVGLSELPSETADGDLDGLGERVGVFVPDVSE
jgi:hypothetical protein